MADSPTSHSVNETARPMESLQECLDWVLSGQRERSQFRIGSEYERLAIGPDGQPLPYESTPGGASIHTLFDRLCERHGWRPYLEAGRPIALMRGMASISLEPAGQFELSGAPWATITEMRAELAAHLAELRDVGDDLGVRLCSVGLNPLYSVEALPKMPKGRYGVMRDIMPRVGNLGMQMMHLTCTVQANIDFSSEAEAAEMLRAGHLLSPALIALFANSPILEGKDTGYATWRAHVWTDVDNARCDVSRFCFDPDAGVRDYVEWCLDVPMYFLDATNPDGSHGYERLAQPTTFRQFFEHGVGGRRPTLVDWELHVSTVFPDVRLKRYIELRQTDVVPPEALPALPALAKGLLYDVTARKAVLDLMRDGDTRIDRAALRELSCRDALNGQGHGFDLREVAGQVLDLASQGLARLAAESGTDHDAATALEPLRAIVTGDSPPFYEQVRTRLAQGGGLLALVDAK